ncbi:MAG: hypothetical protein J7621_29650 [Niastella sp.]|nr:hypothetical protein [Niastella sp.]
MHFKILLLLLLYCLLHLNARGQRTHYSAKDSAVASGYAQKARQQFSLSAEQTDKLISAVIRSEEAKRMVFKRYWKTKAFLQEMKKAVFVKDSAYEAVLGERKFRFFKETLQRDMLEKIKAQQVGKNRSDTATVRP